MSYKVKIIISGPGGCISNEIFVIRKALEQHGCTVTVVGDDDSVPMLDGAMEKHIGGYLGTHVEIVARHEPWEG